MNRIEYAEYTGKKYFYALAVCFSLLTGACVPPESGSYHDAATYQNAIYSEIANRSFTYEGPLRNPVIVIHGLLGARLTDSASGQNIWGDFSYRAISGGSHFEHLAHPMQTGVPLHRLTGNVRSSGVLGQSAVHVMGMEFHISNYDILLEVLRNCGYQAEVPQLPREKHFASMFIFHYELKSSSRMN